MKKGKTFTSKLKRKREGKTHYKKRLKILLSGRPRLVIRKSLKNIQANIVAFDSKGDKSLLSVHSKELEKLGWNFNKGNLPAAYLVGLLLGRKAKNKNIDNAILDLGLNKSVKGSRFYAVLSGALDAGLNIPHNPEILPDKKRMKGNHLVEHALKLKNDKEAFQKQFNNYIKKNVDPEKFIDYFDNMKNRIEEDNHGKERSR